MTMRILATKPNPELVTLPWDTPLEEWPEKFVVQLPRGLSRHVVRFVRVGEHICAVKETDELIARREYHLLRDLQKLGLPTVVPQAVVTGRKDKQGEWLPCALVTRIQLVGGSPACWPERLWKLGIAGAFSASSRRAGAGGS